MHLIQTYTLIQIKCSYVSCELIVKSKVFYKTMLHDREKNHRYILQNNFAVCTCDL